MPEKTYKVERCRSLHEPATFLTCWLGLRLRYRGPLRAARLGLVLFLLLALLSLSAGLGRLGGGLGRRVGGAGLGRGAAPAAACRHEAGSLLLGTREHHTADQQLGGC